MNITGLTVLKLEQALELKREIESLEAKLQELIAAEGSFRHETRSGRRRWRISLAGRKRIAEAQRARWAREKRSAATTKEGQPSRRMSAAARARIAAAQHRRWAAVAAANG